MELNEAIRAARAEAGMTQKELADAIGVHQSSVSDMEKGEIQPSVQRVADIEDALGVPRGRILRMAGLVEDDTTISPLLGKLGRLPERDRRAVERIIDGYLEDQP